MEKRTLQKLGLLCVSVLLCSVASGWSGHEKTDQQVRQLVEQPAVAEVQEIKVTVCVSGAVVKPGLYEVTKGSRAQQVIEMAGGVTEEADMDRVNLAQLCKDGGHIKVPRLSKARMKKLAAEKNGGTQISLNSATETELTQLPGVGAATARKIVAFRNQHGFRSVEDIMKIPGISPAKFAKMKAYLVL